MVEVIRHTRNEFCKSLGTSIDHTGLFQHVELVRCIGKGLINSLQSRLDNCLERSVRRRPSLLRDAVKKNRDHRENSSFTWS